MIVNIPSPFSFADLPGLRMMIIVVTVRVDIRVPILGTVMPRPLPSPCMKGIIFRGSLGFDPQLRFFTNGAFDDNLLVDGQGDPFSDVACVAGSAVSSQGEDD